MKITGSLLSICADRCVGIQPRELWQHDVQQQHVRPLATDRLLAIGAEAAVTTLMSVFSNQRMIMCRTVRSSSMARTLVMSFFLGSRGHEDDTRRLPRTPYYHTALCRLTSELTLLTKNTQNRLGVGSRQPRRARTSYSVSTPGGILFASPCLAAAPRRTCRGRSQSSQPMAKLRHGTTHRAAQQTEHEQHQEDEKQDLGRAIGHAANHAKAKAPAIKAITRKTMVQYNMIELLLSGIGF